MLSRHELPASLDVEGMSRIMPADAPTPRAVIKLNFPRGSDLIVVSDTAARISHLYKAKVEYSLPGVEMSVTPDNVRGAFTPERIRERIAARQSLTTSDPANAEGYQRRNETEERFARLLYGEEFAVGE